VAYLLRFTPERPEQRSQLLPPERIEFDDGAVYERTGEDRPVGSEVTNLDYTLVEGPDAQ
jgi:hypothetical protein